MWLLGTVIYLLAETEQLGIEKLELGKTFQMLSKVLA
jgi:hypothetical protein